jgi:hypothetical protein
MHNQSQELAMDITLTVTLTESQALALAQFVKRVGWQEFRQNAVDDDEAYVIRDAIDVVAKALKNEGFAPR